MTKRLALTAGDWYAWQMLPGYGDEAYYSPIRVDAVIPAHSGRGIFDLRFLNAAYAPGVQQMTYRLRTLRRAESFIVAEALDPDDRFNGRAVIITPLTPDWMRCHFRQLEPRLGRLFDHDGKPQRDEFLTLVG